MNPPAEEQERNMSMGIRRVTRSAPFLTLMMSGDVSYSQKHAY